MGKLLPARKSPILVCLAACLLWMVPAQAQDYPKGPVQLVVPMAAGGAADIFWRAVVDSLAKNLNGTISVINKPGGGGVVGTSSVVNSKPDGYTVAGVNSDTLNVTPFFTPDIPFDSITDLTYIANLGMFMTTIAVRAESPFKTLEEVDAFAKANPKKLKAGVPGIGTMPYMTLHIFNYDAKVDIVPVAFGGGGEVLPQLLGGHLDLAFVAFPTIKSQLLAGKIRVLAVVSPKRHPSYRDIPTAAEKGYKQAVITTGIGLLGPKGLSPAVVKRWEDVAEKTMKEPSVVSAVQQLDYVADFKRGEEFKKGIVYEKNFFKELLDKAGVKPGPQK